MGIKGCDLLTVPLCGAHHRELHKRGGSGPLRTLGDEGDAVEKRGPVPARTSPGGNMRSVTEDFTEPEETEALRARVQEAIADEKRDAARLEACEQHVKILRESCDQEHWRLTEATALLERCERYIRTRESVLRDDIRAFLSRAPAHPAAPETSTSMPTLLHTYQPHHRTGSEDMSIIGNLSQAVDEIAQLRAELAEVTEENRACWRLLNETEAALESAESQLAAVQSAFYDLVIGWRAAGSEYLLKDFRIEALSALLLSPPSPSAAKETT